MKYGAHCSKGCVNSVNEVDLQDKNDIEDYDDDDESSDNETLVCETPEVTKQVTEFIDKNEKFREIIDSCNNEKCKNRLS